VTDSTDTNFLELLMDGPMVIDGMNRHATAAKVKPGLSLRVRLETVEDPGDGAEWDEHRKQLGDLQVMCPECETGDGEEKDCPLCKGVGMVPRKTWDEWYFATKSCRDYKDGCEDGCKRTHCPHDSARSNNSSIVLILEACEDGKKWKARGNSLDGYRLDRICIRPHALQRCLNLIADSINALSSSMFEDYED